MSNVQEALKAAIEYIKSACVDDNFHEASCNVDEIYQLKKAALEGCKAALVEIDKCEPVGEVFNEDKLYCYMVDADIEFPNGTKLYTSPQPRDWVGLSNDYINKLKNLEGANRERTATEMAFAVQAKLRELNT